MKPILIKNSPPPDHSFSIEERISKRFSVPYHFHHEYELTAILKGKGSRFVGNNISRFDDTDMVLIGKNLPHHWHNDNTEEETPEDYIRAIILKFDADFNGIRIFDLPENYQIQRILSKADKGIRIIGETFDRLIHLMERLLNAKGPERISLLLKILNEIAISSDIEVLSDTEYLPQVKENDIDRMNRVYDYILRHYLGKISLPEAASVACMNETAFCKYFKKRYGKTFIQVVNETKISHACRQLMEDDVTVTEVCYSSGFNNISNFTKSFKKIMGVSPNEYKKKVKRMDT
ncbi:AraC family transcriptional regulator [Niabella aquatica]